MQELQAAIACLGDDDELRALVVTGGGQRARHRRDVSGTGGRRRGGRKVRTSLMGHGREMRDGGQAVLAMLRQIDKPSVA